MEKNIVQDIDKKIEEHEAKIAELKREKEKGRLAKLRNLHTELGYENRQELIDDLRKLGGRRTRITDEIREDIVASLKKNETGASIARKYGISVASVQNIKKDAGLVRSRT